MQNSQILVLNSGSSSLKFSLINPSNGKSLLSGLAERLTTDKAIITFNEQDNKYQEAISAPYDHQQAIAALVDKLTDLNLAQQITAIGHRVVHGGETYCQPTLITQEVKVEIAKLAKLAPLHNPANLQGIEAAQNSFSALPQVAIFDTAYHQTLPAKAFIYGLPYELYSQHGIRRYGFHGTSHYFVANQAAQQLDKPIQQCCFISAHLGNGCSVTAIEKGQSVDTSLGFTPLEGVIMGTRSGDVDPGIIFYLVNQLNYTLEQVNSMLNKESGLLGISQLSNDCRELEQQAKQGNEQAQLALEVFCYRIAKSIASFTASLTKLDGVIFTGGIGENSSLVREKIVHHLSLLNLTLDSEKNNATRFGQSGLINSSTSINCFVIPTNEEWVIATQSHELLTGVDK